MIVGVFSPTLHRVGGGELVTINLLNALKENGYQTALSTMKKIDQQKLFNVFGKTINVDKQYIFPFHLFPPYNIKSIHSMALQSYFLKLKCNLFIDAYSHTLFPWSDIIYFQSRKFLNPYNFEEKFSKNKKLYLASYSSLLKILGKNSKFKLLIANSQFMADFINKKITPHLSNVETALLYPPVDTEYFSQEQNELKNFERDGVVVFSRITPEKNLHVIPDIAKLTNQKVSFIIAGSCQSQAYLYELEKKIKEYGLTDRVKIITNLSRQNVRNILLKSKVYLHPAKNEPFGISILEAMAAGCIPLVYDCCGPKEFVPNAYRFKSIEEAAQKIEDSISKWSNKISNEMCAIAKNFNSTKFSNNFINIFEKNIGNFTK